MGVKILVSPNVDIAKMLRGIADRVEQRGAIDGHLETKTVRRGKKLVTLFTARIEINGVTPG